MKKTIIFLKSLIAVCLLLTACSDPYADQFVAEPGTNEQEPILDANFTATMKAGVSPLTFTFDQLANNVALLNATSVPVLFETDTTSVLGYAIQVSQTEDFVVRGEAPVEFDGKAGSDVKVNLNNLNNALLTVDYREAQRPVYLRFIARIVRGGSIVAITTSTMTLESNSVISLKTAIKDGVSPLTILESQAADSLAFVNTIHTPIQTSSVGITYQVQVSNTNTFEKIKTMPASFNGQTGSDINVNYADLNMNVLKLDNSSLNKRTVYVRSVATIVNGDNTIVVYSNVMSAEITPYEVALYPEVLYVPGAHNGWSHVDFINNPDVAEPIVSGYVYLTGEFKFTNQPNWNGTNFGSGGNGTLSTDPGAGNLTVPSAGVYFVNANLDALTWSAQSQVWGIIGSATAGSWDTDTPMTYDAANKVLKITTNLAVGEFKFRANNDWGINLGGTSEAGVLRAGGDNIPIATAGSYTITLKIFNAATYTYTIVKQ